MSRLILCLALLTGLSRTQDVQVVSTWTVHNKCLHNTTADYIVSLVSTLIHPDNVLLLSDCLSESLTEDIQIFSYLSFAIVGPNMVDKIKPKRFGVRRPFIVIDLPEEELANATKPIYTSFQAVNRYDRKWSPIMVVMWHWQSSSQFNFQPTAAVHAFESFHLYFDCSIFLMFLELSYPNPIPTEITLWEMYAIKKRRLFSSIPDFFVHSSDLHTDLSSYTNIVRQQVVSLDGYARRRRNFQLESFTASVKYDPNSREWLAVSKKGNDSYTITGGYSALLYWDLKTVLNFSERVIIGDSPRPFPNGTMGGITVNQLNSDEADLTLSQSTFSVQRGKDLTFLQPTYESIVHVFFKQPAANSVRNVVVSAFERKLWIALIILWVILVMSIHIRVLLLGKSWTFYFSDWPLLSTSKDDRFTKESVLWSVAAVSQKSWYLDPSSPSLRIKVMIGSIVCLISYTAYSASIVSSLTVNKIPVKVFIDLISFKFAFTVHESSEPFKTMLQGMIVSYGLKQEVATTSTSNEISHLFSRSNLKSSKKAFLSGADLFYKTALAQNYTETFICDHISTLTTGSIPAKSGLLVRKGSQFKEILNFMLVYMRGRGTIKRYVNTYDRDSFVYCVHNDQTVVEPVDLGDVYTIGTVLIMGMAGGLILLVVEFVCALCQYLTERCRLSKQFTESGYIA